MRFFVYSGSIIGWGTIIICLTACHTLSSVSFWKSKKTLNKNSNTKVRHSNFLKVRSYKELHRAVKKARSKIKTSGLKRSDLIKFNRRLRSKIPIEIKDLIRTTLAEYYLNKKQYLKALNIYTQIQSSLWKPSAIVEVAKIYYRLDKYSTSLKQLRNLSFENSDIYLSDSLLVQACRLKEVLLAKLDSENFLELLELYSFILSSRLANKMFYRKKASQLIFQLKESFILNLASSDNLKGIQDIIFFRSGQILFYRGQFSRSMSFFKKFLKRSTYGLLEQKALKYIQAIQSRKVVNRMRIGAVLPLTGSSSIVGNRSLQGLQHGLGFYSKEGAEGFQLIVLDNQGLVDQARKAVNTLVIKHHVVGIIGGVLSKTAQAIAQEAQNFGLPAILLSQKSGLTDYGEYIFQNGLSSHLMATALVNFLTNRLSVKYFSLLYPNDHYGVDYANSFWTAVQKKGGVITGAQVYKPGETDFNGSIRRLVGTYYKTDREEEFKENLKNWYIKKSNRPVRRTSLPDHLLPPIVNFKVLFVPDSLKMLNLIAPHIKYHDIKNIYLAGTTLWNQPQKIKAQSQFVNKIFFLDIGLSSLSFKKSSFYKKFFRIFNRHPGLFELQAYESILAFRQIISGGVRSREELRKKLALLGRFHGPIGWIPINKNREFVRPIKVFKVENKVISSVVDY